MQLLKHTEMQKTKKHCIKHDLLIAKLIILKEIEMSLVLVLSFHSFWFLRCHSKCLQANSSGAVVHLGAAALAPWK